MANNFYTRTNDFAPFTKVRGGDVKAEFDAVEAAFDQLPDITDILSGNPFYLEATGSGDAMEVANLIPWETYTDKGGYRLSIKVPSVNTGIVTLNVDGLGARPVRRNDNEPLIAGDVVSGGIYDMIYDDAESAFKIQVAWQGLIQEAEEAATTATAQASIATTKAGEASSSVTQAAEEADRAAVEADAAEGFKDAAEIAASAAGASAGLPALAGKGGLPLIAKDDETGVEYSGSLKRYDLASVATTATLDISYSNVFVVDASLPRTLAFSNVPAAGRAAGAVVKINGASAITWPASVDWGVNGAPILGASWTVVTLFFEGSSCVGAVGNKS